MSQPSNQVDIQVQRTTPQPATLQLFHFTNQPGAQPFNLPQTICQGSGGPRPVHLQGAFSQFANGAAPALQANAIRAGEPLLLRVSAAAQNVNAGAVDSFEATITTQNGDRERITLTETAANSGIFLGIINTAATPANPVIGDCVLTVRPGDELNFDLGNSSTGTSIATASVDVLVDPFGLTFDSADGVPVSGTRVTIVDAATGTPAQVFGDDGVSTFPNSLIAGSTVTDSSGAVYNFDNGFYRFPFLRPGQYRLVIEPVAPYRHPSAATPAEIAMLTRPDGGQFIIADGSYGGIITLSDPAPVRIDVPLDRPGGALSIHKETSAVTAMPGDVVQYRIEVRNPDRTRNSGPVTVTDILPEAMRLRLNSMRWQGTAVTPTVSADGKEFSVAVPPLSGGQSGVLTYLTEVRQDARPGNAINLASARDNRGAASGTTDAAIRILRDGISERYTIIGRITDGGCSVDPRKAKGLQGIRVMLEDGTYTVTDIDGRYHFEGVIPGIHVVQVDPMSFPLDQKPVDCAKNTRSAGNPISRFVEGRGGSLKRADFRAVQTAPREDLRAKAAPLPSISSDSEAAGADRDWFAGQTPGTGFLFPETGHNPRSRAIRVVFKHLPRQKIELLVNGKPVDPLNFDGSKKSPEGKMRAAIWRGITIDPGVNILTAKVFDQDGKMIESLDQKVIVAGAPINAQMLKERSLLLADGVTRPRIAVRLTDRNGNPIPHSAIGDFTLTDPYRPAVEIDAQQANQLSGLERAAPVWRVQGDDGVAYIELEPTTASGTVAVGFNFRDGEVERTQRIET
ncbi:carboxypeptidase-like regulatory domain-containing protein, partial [Sphingorhabdus sp.]|uniref:carboxypeptidase-like regulatory domain-containing protein n=1 Tax=Sphingorhabdus sp. TaxID=1902408 RepID=UPI003BAFFD1F